MNKSAAKRLISKQESVVLLGNLDLVTSSETIETVSISNSKQIRKAESTSSSKTIMDAYIKRPIEQEQMNLKDFFHFIKNNNQRTKKNALIPHFVGICGTPKYPVTADFAKHEIVIYKPWRQYPKSDDWITDYNIFVNSSLAPTAAKITYQRILNRFLSNTQDYEPTSETYDNTKNPIDMNSLEILELLGIHKSELHEVDDSILLQLHKGENYHWSKEQQVCHGKLRHDLNSPLHKFRNIMVNSDLI